MSPWLTGGIGWGINCLDGMAPAGGVGNIGRVPDTPTKGWGSKYVGGEWPV